MQGFLFLYSSLFGVWTDQDTTFQEITADTEIERPYVSVEKQVMRQHMCNLLNVLSLRETYNPTKVRHISRQKEIIIGYIWYIQRKSVTTGKPGVVLAQTMS